MSQLARTAAPRAWQRMLSGRRLDLLDPSPFDIEVEDIAHGLARVARWNGQTSGEHIFSVAQHCLLVDQIAQLSGVDVARKDRLAILLHDAAEYVVGDMISPFKAAMGGEYKAVEKRIQSAVHMRFGLKPELDVGVLAEIKRCDTIAAYFEAVRLAGFQESEARRFFGRPQPPFAAPDTFGDLQPVPANEAKRLFLDRFGELTEE